MSVVDVMVTVVLLCAALMFASIAVYALACAVEKAQDLWKLRKAQVIRMETSENGRAVKH